MNTARTERTLFFVSLAGLMVTILVASLDGHYGRLASWSITALLVAIGMRLMRWSEERRRRLLPGRVAKFEADLAARMKVEAGPEEPSALAGYREPPSLASETAPPEAPLPGVIQRWVQSRDRKTDYFRRHLDSDTAAFLASEEAPKVRIGVDFGVPADELEEHAAEVSAAAGAP